MGWFKSLTKAADKAWTDTRDAVVKDPFAAAAPFFSPDNFEKALKFVDGMATNLLGMGGGDAPPAALPTMPSFESRKAPKIETDARDRRNAFLQNRYARPGALTSQLSVGRKSLLGA